jgi:tetratricopeptide (TPR) repeat protein
MRQLITYILIVLNLGSFAQGEVLKKAEKAFDARQYKEAADLYEGLINTGWKSSELYFNAGNSYFKLNRMGKAIYYYELARVLNPNDDDVKINLSIANGKTIDKIETRENFFINAVKTNVLQSFSTTQWAWMTILLLTLALICLFSFFISEPIVLKKITLSMAVVFVIAFGITYLLGYSAASAKNNNKFAIILSSEISIQNEPQEGGTVKFKLHEGTKVRVIRANGDWSLIALDNGNEGWVPVKSIGVI